MIPHLRLIALSLCAAAAVPVSAQTRVAPSQPISQNGVAANVNGRVITRSEVETAAKYKLLMLLQAVTDPQDREAKEKEALSATLQDLVDRELVLSEFKRLGASIKSQYIDEDIQRLIRENFEGSREKFLLELRKRGISWQKFREQHEKSMIVQAMRSQQTNRLAFPTPHEKEEYFRKNEADFREEGSVWLKTIAIPSLTGDPGVPGDEQRRRQRKLATEIRRRIVDGADFASQARAYSADSKAASGGDWGMTTRAALAPQLAEVAFSIPEKTVSQVFEFRGFYYVMLVEQRKYGALKPQKEIDDLLDRLVMSEKRKQAVDEWLLKLRKQATVVYPDPTLQPPPAGESSSVIRRMGAPR